MKDGETLIFSCAGAAHCGQVANRAALKLTADGVGQIFCLAAISADRPEKVQRTWDAGRRVVIDGCDDRCAYTTMEKADMPVDFHAVVTDLGVKKSDEASKVTADAEEVARHIQAALGSSEA